MPTRRTACMIIAIFTLGILLVSILCYPVPGASSRTIVVGGAVTSSEHVELTDTFTVTGLIPSQLSSASKVTYNAPVYASNGVSGFSQTVSGFGLTVSPTPASTSGPLTDAFGNPYYHYEWSLKGYAQNNFVITVTTYFDCTATGNPVPECFDDPYPVASSGMSQFLQPTGMAQSDNAQIASLAQSLVSGMSTEAAAVEQIMDYVKEHVNNNPNPDKDAVSTLTAGYGACTNRANLVLALLRAAGVPARFVNGIVCKEPYSVDFLAPEGQGTMETGWYGQEAHNWVEVYYPQKGTWAGYDPYLNFGFVDQRHVKGGIAVDSDIVGRTTGGLGNLLETLSLNYGTSVQHTIAIGFSQVYDSGSYSFRMLKDPPGGTGIYVLGRDMVNAPTPAPTPAPGVTPAPTPASTPTPAPGVTPAPTPAPDATAAPPTNASITPAPGLAANASTNPGQSPADNTAHPGVNVTTGAGNGTYNISGSIIDATTGKAPENMTITFDGQPVRADAYGTYTVQAGNGTHTLAVSAPGYGSSRMTVTVAGADVTQTARLTGTVGDGGSESWLPIPCFGIATAITGLLIIALYRHGRA